MSDISPTIFLVYWKKKIIKRDACRLRSSFLANLQRGVGTSQHKMSSWQQHTPRSLMRPLYYTLQRLGWGHHNFPKAGNHALILRTLMTKVRAHLFWQSGIYIHEFYVFSMHCMVFIECVAPRVCFVHFSQHFSHLLMCFPWDPSKLLEFEELCFVKYLLYTVRLRHIDRVTGLYFARPSYLASVEKA